MANANTNIMSIGTVQSTGSNSKNSQLQSGGKYSRKGGSDFNSALDRANNTLNRQAAPIQQNPSDAEEVSYSDAATKNPDAPVESKDANTASTQGENTKPQDAPQSLPQNQSTTKNVPAEVDAKTVLPNDTPENIPLNVEIKPAENQTSENLAVTDISTALPYVFAPNTEALLQPQATENIGEVNLMTVMPQTGENKGQEMLNILSGKTWTSADVQATLTAQNQPTAETNPGDLIFQQSGKNFTLNTTSTAENIQPQIQTQSAGVNAEQSPQIQTQAQAQTPLQAQVADLSSAQSPQPTMQRQIEIQNQPILNSLQPQVEPKQTNQLNQMSELLGVTVQVEDNQNAPLSPIQPMLRQQSEQQNQQSANQNTNQNLQQQTVSQDLTAEMQVQSQSAGVEETFAQNLTPAPTVDNVSTTQPTTPTQNPEAAAQTARDAETVPAQIVEQARLIRNSENTEMVINLKPEHLGQLTLRVSVSQNGAVNASFYSDNAQVRAAIENSLVQLRQELNDQGLKVDNVQVSSYLSDGGLTNGQGGQAWQQQQQQSNRNINFESLQDEVDAVNPENETSSADGVDYKI